MSDRLQNQCFEKGIIGSSGTCVAHCYVFKKRIEVERRSITEEQIPEEIQRLDFAIKKTADDIQNFRKRAEERHGEKYAAIFDSHLLMLEDPHFRPKLVSRIEKDRINVECAVRERIDEIHKGFAAIADPYLRERAIDIKDVGDRLLRHLLGLDEPADKIDGKPYVLVAQEVTPSELLDFARGELRGICLDTGGATSHVAILSDALGIPSIFGLNDFSEKVNTDDVLIIDTRTSPKIIVNPKSEVITAFEESIEKDSSSLKKSEITSDGIELHIGANVARVEEIPTLQKLGVKHIGLFRSEFVFMESLDSPSEKYQTEVYSELVKGVPGTVVLRTLDIGSDKPLKYLPLNDENNPAMGFRSVRFSLSRPDVLEPQLRAMIKAAQYGNCRILFPMVSIPNELKKISELFNKIVDEIKPEKVPEWGIMLEVPSTAFMLNEIAKYTNYISVGTNDLMQFFFAIDRTNEKLSGYADFLSMPFMRFMNQFVSEAVKLNIKVGACGEMASDPAGFIALLGIGVEEFGMRPAVIDKMRELIPNLNKKNITGFIKNILKRKELVNIRQLIELTYL
ncbi:MAG: phosphoenolpyruvate--protein phosphotransferase [Candidatus Riflebacteria bacterium]|nr:phosphoenolpyruvate--protein phosphotransferase [Candidatus Riflebacteria bacterium]